MTTDDLPPVYLTDEREPTGQLDREAWLTAPETRTVMDALCCDGEEARFVGGCVRDALLKRGGGAFRDIDIATTRTPESVMAVLNRPGVTVIPVGVAHGTVRAIVGDMPFEITTLRRDARCDGRHAEVAFTRSFREDALRRDFTINALSADRTGAVYDYGEGIADLAARRVRFVGRAMDRIREDYLRILRFFRFHAWYGVGAPDGDALSACQSLADGIDGLSAERVRLEMLRLLEAPDPTDTLARMIGARVLERVFPRADGLANLRTLVMLENRGLEPGVLTPDPFRRLASLLGAGGGTPMKESDRTFARFRLSRAETRRMTGLLCADPARWPIPAMREAELRRLVLEDGAPMILDRLVLRWAAERTEEVSVDPERTAAWRSVLATVRAWSPPAFPVSGRSLVRRGLSGAEIGRALEWMKAEWIEGGCRQSGQELLALWEQDPESAP